MAHAKDKNVMLEKARKVIPDNNLFFIEDIPPFIPCSKSTFYKYFPDGSTEMNELKEMLEENRIATKVRIRMKLERGEKAAELLALYKLICNDEERRALSMQYQETKLDEQVGTIKIEIVRPSETK